MEETVEEFLARGGKIKQLAPDERAYKDERAMNRARKQKQDEDNYTDFRMRQAENGNY
jgi:hypothetical protein